MIPPLNKNFQAFTKLPSYPACLLKCIKISTKNLAMPQAKSVVVFNLIQYKRAEFLPLNSAPTQMLFTHPS